MVIIGFSIPGAPDLRLATISSDALLPAEVQSKSDSLSLREFLGVGLSDRAPDHSSVSRTRRLIDLETHAQVFGWMLERLSGHGLIDGKTVGVDATTLEANAAMRSIVRRDTGNSYEDFLKELAEASGIPTPTRSDLARLDRKRPKKGSNDDWVHREDPDAQITKMKDGRTSRPEPCWG